MARYIAKNLVAAGVADRLLIQVAYAIGVAEPISIFVNTYGTAKVKLSDKEIADKITQIFDLRPASIVKTLKLNYPIYSETAAYGHFGRTHRIVTKQFKRYDYTLKDIVTKNIEVELFPWEKLDKTEEIKKVFGI